MVPYLLIFVLVTSSGREVVLRPVKDLLACAEAAEEVEARLFSVQGEWKATTRCVPILRWASI